MQVNKTTTIPFFDEMNLFFSNMSRFPKPIFQIVCDYFDKDVLPLLGRFEDWNYSYTKHSYEMRYIPRFLPYGILWKIQHLSILLIDYTRIVNSHEKKFSALSEEYDFADEHKFNQARINTIRRSLGWEDIITYKSETREKFAADQIEKIGQQFKISRDCLSLIKPMFDEFVDEINKSFKYNKEFLNFDNFKKFDEFVMSKMEPLKSDELLSKSIVDNLFYDKGNDDHNWQFQLEFANSIYSNPNFLKKLNFIHKGNKVIEEQGMICTRDDVNRILGTLKMYFDITEIEMPILTSKYEKYESLPSDLSSSTEDFDIDLAISESLKSLQINITIQDLVSKVLKNELLSSEFLSKINCINQFDLKGNTALIHAIKLGNPILMRQLITAKADVNLPSKDSDGDTPLMHAAKDLSKIAILTMDILLQSGANKLAKNKNGETALDIAKESKNRDKLKLLGFSNGPDDSKESEEGMSKTGFSHPTDQSQDFEDNTDWAEEEAGDWGDAEVDPDHLD